MAPGTSSALPRPAPTWPRPSPTTTIAENENRRPPFTTFDTRFIWTTRSVSSRRFASIFAITFLKPQPRASGGIAQRFDSPVIAVAARIEDRLADALGLRLVAEHRADRLRPLGLLPLAVLGIDARRGNERLPRVVVD